MQKHIEPNNDERRHFFRKIYLSLYWKGCVWEGVGDRTELQHIDPPLLWPSACLDTLSQGRVQYSIWGLIRVLYTFITTFEPFFYKYKLLVFKLCINVYVLNSYFKIDGSFFIWTIRKNNFYDLFSLSGFVSDETNLRKEVNFDAQNVYGIWIKEDRILVMCRLGLFKNGS